MYCIHCGAEHPDSAKYCQNCGEAIVRTQSARVEPEAVQTEKEALPSPQKSKTNLDDWSQESIPSQPKLEEFVAAVPANHDVYFHPIKGFKSVKIGFSWPAFFLGFWWSLYKTLWLNAVLYWVVLLVPAVLIGIIFGLARANGSEFLYYFYALGVSVFWGANGNTWVRTNLIKHGYECVRENSESGGIPTQNSQMDSETADIHQQRFNCPFCHHAMADYGQCSKCGNTVDQWVLEANS